MIDVARALFNFDIVAPPEPVLVRFAQDVFGRFDAAAGELLPFDDYSLYLAVEEGSLKGGGKVAVTLGALYIGIGQFGDFVSGVREIDSLGRAVATQLVDAAADNPLVRETPRGYSRRDAGDVSRLERLFVRVRDRELTPEQAVAEAIAIFESKGERVPPPVIHDLMRGFESIKLHPEQLLLDLGVSGAPAPEPRRDQNRRPKSPPLPSSDRLIVVIERDHRSDKPRTRTERR